MKPIKTMTAEQISARLIELDILTQQHASRDMDAELAGVLSDGGDVDALEAQHIEAERAVRRLRVERQALQAALPEAVKREGADQIKELALDHATLASGAAETAKVMREAWDRFASSLDEWTAIQERAESLTRRTGAIGKATGADVPPMGRFLSAGLGHIALAAGEIYNLRRLVSSQEPMMTPTGLQGTRLD